MKLFVSPLTIILYLFVAIIYGIFMIFYGIYCFFRILLKG